MATLLYVDDEETIGRLVSRYFSRRGDRVLLATSIAEARDTLAHEDPDAVFIDVWLGREKGIDLARWIAEYRPTLVDRVMFVTGELAGQGADWAEGETVNRPVIQKPFDLATLAGFIHGAGSRAST